jgi:hypothetical protein
VRLNPNTAHRQTMVRSGEISGLSWSAVRTELGMLCAYSAMALTAAS